MAADYSRIHRLLEILMLIQGSRGWSAGKLAQHCGATQRTIYRDMKMLEAAGIPYFYDHQAGGYCIQKDFFLPPMQLTLDEALALTALAQHIGAGRQVPFTQPAGRAIAKVRSQLPPSIRGELDGLEDHLSIKLAASSDPQAADDVYQSVRGAMAARRALRCRYESPSSADVQSQAFLFKPYTLFFNQRAWYAIGLHGGHGEVRCLKLSRFIQTASTDVAYRIPADFSLSRYLGNAWRMMRGKHSYEVELWFDAQFAENIADTQWHATQEVVWHEDRSITFRCKVDGLEEIVWWILGMGPHCSVRKPAVLADMVRDLAAGVVEQYRRRKTTKGDRGK